LNFIRSSDLIAVTKLPEDKEDVEMETGWDKIMME
jgi:hypothetical protein